MSNFLNNKDIDSNDMLNLTRPTILFSGSNMPYSIFEVDDEWYEGRPDLISLFNFENAENYDYILKYNNIYNPFAINKGDVLNIPFLFDIVPFNDIKIRDTLRKSTIRRQFLRTKRKERNRIDMRHSKVLLPPNMLHAGRGDVDVTKVRAGVYEIKTKSTNR